MSNIDIPRTVGTIAAEIEAYGETATRPGQRGGLLALAAQIEALPALIECQVREQVHHAFRSTPASQMVGVQKGRSQDYYDGVADALYWAAGIARGEQS